MRKVYVAYFKPDTGKYYASEEKEFDEKLSVNEIVDKVNELSADKYKGMFIGTLLNNFMSAFSRL